MASLIIRPSSDASVALTTFGTGSYHYDRLNESTADDTDGVQSNSTDGSTDRYGIENPSAGGAISSVDVYVRIWTDTSGLGAANVGVYIGSTQYYPSTGFGFGTTATDLSKSWSTNPNTSAAWTWTDINNLEILLFLVSHQYYAGEKLGYVLSTTFCSQLWVVVNYTTTLPLFSASNMRGGFTGLRGGFIN